jgi:radical SAM protein with 4Fe4S-binding SPASM domain
VALVKWNPKLNEPIRLPRPIVERKIEDKHLFLAPVHATWISVDDVGAVFVRNLREGKTLRGAITATESEFDFPPGSSDSSIRRVLIQMHRNGFLEEVEVVDYLPSVEEIALHCYLTGRCNLRCVHCYMDSGGAWDREITTADWINAIDQFCHQGGRLVTLSGGEPLVSRSWKPVAQAARDRGANLCLLTNGTLIERNLEEIASLFETIQVSLDGATAAVNDQIRGPGVFAQVLRTTRLLSGSGVRLRLGITLCQQNVEDFAENFTDLLDEFSPGEIEVLIGTVQPSGRGALIDQPIDADYEDVYESMLTELWRRGWSRSLQRARINLRYRNCIYGLAPNIAPNGDVYPCSFLHTPAGNITEEPLRNIWSRMKEERQGTGADELPVCFACDLRYFCGGGCQIRNFREKGDVHSTCCSAAYKYRFYRRMARGKLY